MNEKKFYFGSDNRKEILEGASYLFNAVKTTMGPGGRNVLIQKMVGDPVITKDGITVAKEVKVGKNIQDMAIDILRQATAKTADLAGDGTTTTTILAYHILQNGIKGLTDRRNVERRNVVEVKKGIDRGVMVAIDKLKKFRKDVTEKDIVNVARISSNGDEDIVNLVIEAINSSGEYGHVDIKISQNGLDGVHKNTGFKFRNGYINNHFINNETKRTSELNNPYIFLSKIKLNVNTKALEKTLNLCQQENRDLLIITDDISDDLLNVLAQLKLNNIINLCVVKAPGFGMVKDDYYTDISKKYNCQIIDEFNYKSKGEEFYKNVLGTCEKCICEKYSTIIFGGHDITEHVNNLKALLDLTKNSYEANQIKERLANLTSGLITIEVGGKTEAEANERKDRVDDAYFACKSAIEEGVVPGGGLPFYKIGLMLIDDIETMRHASIADDPLNKELPEISDFDFGIQVVGTSLLEPMRQLLENSGIDKTYSELKFMVAHRYNNNSAMDVLSGECIDAYENGIVDPFKVERLSLEHAASVAGVLLTSECSLALANGTNRTMQIVQ